MQLRVDVFQGRAAYWRGISAHREHVSLLYSNQDGRMRARDVSQTHEAVNNIPHSMIPHKEGIAIELRNHRMQHTVEPEPSSGVVVALSPRFGIV